MPIPFSPGGPDQSDLLPPHLGREAQAAAREGVIQALGKGEPRSRGAALMLQGKPGAAAQQALALEHRDLLLAHWGLQSCAPADRLCRQRMISRAIEVDGDNLASRLELLTLEPQRRDEWRRAFALAKRFDFYWGALAAEVARVEPPRTWAYLRSGLVVEAFGLEAAIAVPGLQSLVSLCKPPPAPGNEVQAQCSAIARTMVERSDTLLVYSIGIRLGEAAGWPTEELSRLRKDKASMEQSSTADANSDQPWSCASVAAMLSRAEAIGSKGEMGFLRERMAASPR